MKSAKSGWILLLVAAIVSLSLRLIHLGEFITPQGVFFYGADPYDHMRRVFLTLWDFPHVPAFNYYQGYPEGSTLIFSPLFQLIIAVVAKIVGLWDPSTFTVEVIGALTPVFVCAITLPAFYLLCREFMGGMAAGAAAVVFGILPGYLQYSFVGQMDNNSTEPLMSALYMLFLLRSLKDERHGLRYALLAAFAGTSALFVWRGFTLLWGVGLCTLLIYSLLQQPHAEKPKGHGLWQGMVIFGIKGAVLLLMAGQEAFTVKAELSFSQISYFHALFTLAAAVCFSSVYARRTFVRSSSRWASFLLDSAFFVLPAALLPVLSPRVLEEIRGAYAYMGQGHLWLGDIIEYSPVLIEDGSFSFMKPTARLSLFFWLVPAFGLWHIKRILAGKSAGPGEPLLLASSSAFLISSLSHMRFMNLLCLSVALYAGLTIEYAILPVKDMKKKMVAWAVFLAMLAPVLPFVYGFAAAPPSLMSRQKEILGMMAWMRENTPETSYFEHPTKLPEYGVMGEWSMGSWIENVAHRPAVATPFGDETHGLRESIGFLLSGDEDEASRILDENRVRYVIVSKIIASLDNFARIAGLKAESYARLSEGQGGGEAWTPAAGYYQLVSTSLFLNEGMPFKEVPLPVKRLHRFRLLYESESELKGSGLPHPVKLYKVFEYVKGARLIVSARPGDEVTVTLPVITNQGRTYEYYDRKDAGPDGRASFVLPYSTRIMRNATTATGPYRVMGKGRGATLDVTEEMVLEGKELKLDLG